jgi:O-antigen/teichoic acid export membrane protein
LWPKIRQATLLLRLKPFDTSTPDGRSKERYRRIALTSVTAIAAKGIGILTALISVPLTIDYLGIERYGLWMTMSSVIALLGFADLGIGNGLLNAVAEADGKDDRDAACRYVSSAFFILLGIAIILLALLVSVYSFISWQRVYNVTSKLAIKESGPATALLITMFIVNMPLGVVQRVQMGYQEGVRNHLWAIAGALAGFGGLLCVVNFKGGLQWLVLAVSGGPVLVMLINWFWEFKWLKPWLFPHWSAFDWETGRKIVSTGILFLILQIFSIIGNSSDNIVIAQILGVSAVASYSVTQKLFSVFLISQYFSQSLWPAFGEALARSDYNWAQRTLTRALKVSILVSFICGIPLLLCGKWIISIWAGPNLVPSSLLLWGYFLWLFVASYGGSLASYNNHGDLLNKQVIFHGTASVIVLFLKIVLAHVQGVEGVIWGTALGYSIFSLIPLTILSYRSLSAGNKSLSSA